MPELYNPFTLNQRPTFVLVDERPEENAIALYDMDLRAAPLNLAISLDFCLKGPKVFNHHTYPVSVDPYISLLTATETEEAFEHLKACISEFKSRFNVDSLELEELLPLIEEKVANASFEKHLGPSFSLRNSLRFQTEDLLNSSLPATLKVLNPDFVKYQRKYNKEYRKWARLSREDTFAARPSPPTFKGGDTPKYLSIETNRLIYAKLMFADASYSSRVVPDWMAELSVRELIREHDFVGRGTTIRNTLIVTGKH